jgi:hypothetical protein
MEELIRVLSGKFHATYKETIEKAKLYQALTTGEGLDEMMLRFERREDEIMFKQRKKITKHITNTIVENLMKPCYKIPRSNAARKILTFDNSEEKEKFNKILWGFYGNESLDEYLDRVIELNFVDPNSFLVIEWKEDVKPYPFEVSSEMAVDYNYINNVLQYLIVAQKEDVKTWTYYGMDRAIKVFELKNDELPTLVVDTKYEPADNETVYMKINGKIYRVYFPTPYKLGYVPARQIGYKKERKIVSPIFMSYYSEAVPILEKTIKANSEFDLTMALHAFPQKAQYIEECSNIDCTNGYLIDGEKCPSCGGSGLQIVTSAQDAITMKLPRNKDEMINLTEILTYFSPPVDLLTFQDNYLKSLSAQAKEAVYNSDIYSNKQIADTATGQNIDLQSVYDSLYPLAKHYALFWEFCIKTIADITEFSDRKGFNYSYSFGKDFKLKSIADLYSDLEKVDKISGAQNIKQSIYDDIARIMYEDDEIAYMKYIAKNRFNPFEGKTSEEVAMIISMDIAPEKDVVLWANFGNIFDKIEYEQPEFFSWIPSRQKTYIDERVDEIIKSLPKAENPNFFQVKT